MWVLLTGFDLLSLFCADGGDLDVVRGAIEGLPSQDNPELFGLHANADIAFRTLQVISWINNRVLTLS